MIDCVKDNAKNGSNAAKIGISGIVNFFPKIRKISVKNDEKFR